jgi:hypothetical protein
LHCACEFYRLCNAFPLKRKNALQAGSIRCAQLPDVPDGHGDTGQEQSECDPKPYGARDCAIMGAGRAKKDFYRFGAECAYVRRFMDC